MSFQSRRLSEDKNPRVSIPWDKVAVGALALLQPLFGIYRSWKKDHDIELKHQRRVHLLKKLAIILLSILLSLLLLAGIVKALVATRVLSLHTLFAVAGKELPHDADGNTNFLLLGRGDADHDGIDLTDSMMIVSIDPSTHSVAMVSLPRDLYMIKTEKMGKGRINELYRNYKQSLRHTQDLTSADASGQSLRELMGEISRTFGVEIHHAAIVDFSGFVKAVDAIGGVQVNVPYDIIDTEYPGPNYSYQTFEIRSGLQTLNGDMALKYARSRHTTSDFGRSARQQQLLTSMAEKAKTDGILGSAGKITSLLKILSEHTETTMSIAEIIGAASLADGIDRERMIMMQLNVQNGSDTATSAPGGFLYFPPREQFGGASVVLPLSIPPSPITWKQIQTFTRLLLHHRSIHLAHPVISVRNASGKRGLATTLANEFIRYGFEVSQVGNASIPKQDESAVLAATEQDLALATFFGTLLKLPVRIAANELPMEELSQITVVLGKQYEYVPFQDLLPQPE